MSTTNQAKIAAHLNISRTTVTKALNNHPQISDKTIERVQKAADELGYIMNNMGRNLVKNQTFTIGLIVPKIAHSFYSTVFETIYNHGNKKGYEIIPMVSFENSKREIAMIKNLLAMKVDGLILDITENTNNKKIFDLIKEHDVPLVLFDRSLPNLGFSKVMVDDFAVTKKAVIMAINKGYKKFGYIGGSLNISTGINRINGFKNGLQESGIIIEENKISTGGYSKQFGYESTKSLRRNGHLPEILFCASDEIAFGVYEAADELDLNIPNDLAVVGFGDLEISKYLTPPLSTISMPIDRMSYNSIKILVREIESSNKKITSKELKAKIIVRLSF